MPGAAEHCRRTVLFAGQVQGVGFRYTVERIARRFRVTGYVRNLRDGRVEVVAEGTSDEIGRFVAQIEETMAGCVHDRQIEDSPATGDFGDFSIRF
jgi:acylphosphatase